MISWIWLIGEEHHLVSPDSECLNFAFVEAYCANSTRPSYGEHGWNIIVNILLLKEDEILAAASEADESVTPLDNFESFVKNIGVHQATVVLISLDYDCSMADAAHDAWLSEPYGESEFPVDDKDPVLVDLRRKVFLKSARQPKKRSLLKMPRSGANISRDPIQPIRITRSMHLKVKCLLPGLGVA